MRAREGSGEWVHPSPTHFSTAAGRQGETSRRTSDVSYFLSAAPCKWDDSRSPNSGAMRSTFGNRASLTCADPPWRATPRNPRTSPPWRPNSRVAMSSPILLWWAAPRTLRTGDALQAPPPELLAPERGRPSPAAQRGGVGARRRGRIAGSPLDAADGVARILSVCRRVQGQICPQLIYSVY